MKKSLIYLFLVIGIVLPFSVKAVSTNISLSCDKTNLKFGESTKCYVELKSDYNLTGWIAKITTGKGLKIERAISLNDIYKVHLKGDQLKLSVIGFDSVLTSSGIATGTDIPTLSPINKQDIILLYVSATKEVNTENSYIELKTLKNCTEDVMGDLTKDGKIDVDDARKALAITVGKIEQTNEHLIIADFDEDNKISATDALNILKISKNNLYQYQYPNLGDVDNDGKLTKEDAENVLSYVVGKTPSNFNAGVADMNGDDAINLEDALIILQLINSRALDNEVYFQCLAANQNENSNNSIVKFNLTNEVKVPATAASLSIILSILSICLVGIGIMFIIKIKKAQTQE